jgi:hypothetical protein
MTYNLEIFADIDDVTAKPSLHLYISKSVEKIPDFLGWKNYMVFERFESPRQKRGAAYDIKPYSMRQLGRD